MSEQKDWINYDASTGEILLCFSATEKEANLNKPEGTELIIHNYLSAKEFYIDKKKPKPRPIITPAFQDNFVSQLPKNGKVFINGSQYDYKGTSIEFTFEYPGDYSIEIQSWPFQPCHFTLSQP